MARLMIRFPGQLPAFGEGGKRLPGLDLVFPATGVSNSFDALSSMPMEPSDQDGEHHHHPEQGDKEDLHAEQGDESSDEEEEELHAERSDEGVVLAEDEHEQQRHGEHLTKSSDEEGAVREEEEGHEEAPSRNWCAWYIFFVVAAAFILVAIAFQ